MYTPEERQKHVGRPRTTLYQRQIRLLCITWLPVEGAGQSGQRARHALIERSKQTLGTHWQFAQRSSNTL